MPYAKRTDVTDDYSTVYIGRASVGSSPAEPVWQISKTELGIDDDITVLWADGDAEFNKVWDDRLLLTYS